MHFLFLDSPSFTPILTWNVVEKKVCWGVIILLGGGFAIANASEVCVYAFVPDLHNTLKHFFFKKKKNRKIKLHFREQKNYELSEKQENLFWTLQNYRLTLENYHHVNKKILKCQPEDQWS